MSLPVGAPLWKLGCTGEFGCLCPKKQQAHASRAKDQGHGTRKRYVKHLRDGEQPCARCNTANRAYQRRWRKQKGK